MLKKSIAGYPLVAIEWDDAETDSGWKNREEHEDPVDRIAYTVGYLIRKTDNHYIVAATVDADGASNNRIQIPKGMVKKMVDLTIKKQKKTLPLA